MTNQNITPLEQHSFYMLLFNLILRQNGHLRLDVIEAIRKILLHPMSDYPLSPAVLDMLQSLQSDLLASPQPEIVSEMSRPSVRLVENNFPKQVPPKK